MILQKAYHNDKSNTNKLAHHQDAHFLLDDTYRNRIDNSVWVHYSLLVEMLPIAMNVIAVLSVELLFTEATRIFKHPRKMFAFHMLLCGLLP